MSPRRRKRAATQAVRRGPNHQLNALREQLDAQLKTDAALEATEDPSIQEALETEINNRNRTVVETLDEFLHDPFSHQPLSDFNNAEKNELRSFRAALVAELQNPSPANKTALKVANESLLRLMGPDARTSAENTKECVPMEYRHKHLPSLDATTNLPQGHSHIAKEERAMQSRPRNLRAQPDQPLYEVEDPNIKHLGPLGQQTWDTIATKQPPEWNLSTADDELCIGSKRNKRKKEKKKQSGDGNEAKKRKIVGPVRNVVETAGDPTDVDSDPIDVDGNDGDDYSEKCRHPADFGGCTDHSTYLAEFDDLF